MPVRALKPHGVEHRADDLTRALHGQRQRGRHAHAHAPDRLVPLLDEHGGIGQVHVIAQHPQEGGDAHARGDLLVVLLRGLVKLLAAADVDHRWELGHLHDDDDAEDERRKEHEEELAHLPVDVFLGDEGLHQQRPLLALHGDGDQRVVLPVEHRVAVGDEGGDAQVPQHRDALHLFRKVLVQAVHLLVGHALCVQLLRGVAHVFHDGGGVLADGRLVPVLEQDVVHHADDDDEHDDDARGHAEEQELARALILLPEAPADGKGVDQDRRKARRKGDGQVQRHRAQHVRALGCVDGVRVAQRKVPGHLLAVVHGHEQHFVSAAVDEPVVARLAQALYGKQGLVASGDPVLQGARGIGAVEPAARKVQDRRLELALVRKERLRALEHVLDAIVAVDAFSVGDGGLHVGDDLLAHGGIVALLDLAVVLVKAQKAHERNQRQRQKQEQAEDRDDGVDPLLRKLAHAPVPPSAVEE